MKKEGQTAEGINRWQHVLNPNRDRNVHIIILLFLSYHDVTKNKREIDYVERMIDSIENYNDENWIDEGRI